ncbi:MAG: MFS transporter [Hyphomonadaceae bacterium]|nr:MFS transporter [Hyphomonadaceae bacterium]
MINKSTSSAKVKTKTDTEREHSLIRLAAIGAIGNVLEWYDFAIYGFFATILAANYFPSDNPTVSLVASFGAFAAGFLMRPVGGALFGHIGDTIARNRALFLSILMMAVPTGLLALLPTYQVWGVWAAILVVVLRMAQGLAVGGEYTGSIVYLAEHAPPGKRAFMTAFPMAGATLGILLASGVGAFLSAILTPEQLTDWGWRVAFGVGILVSAIGFIIRRGLPETEIEAPETAPLIAACRHHWWGMVQAFGLVTGAAAGFYLGFIFIVTWLVQNVHESRATALEINTLALAVMLVTIPFWAYISDQIGRRRMLLIGYSGLVVTAYPLIWLMYHPDPLLITIGQMGFAIVLPMVMASLPATMVELFSRTVRSTAVGLSYNLTFAIFGGTAPMVAVWINANSHNPLGFAWYLVGLCGVSLLFAMSVASKHNLPLTDKHSEA